MIKGIRISENLVKHYSNSGMYIKQVETGVEYAEAIDIIPCECSVEIGIEFGEDEDTIPCNYKYKETEKPIFEQEITEV